MSATSPPTHVCALFLNENDQILLIRNGASWQFPVAPVDEGEAMDEVLDGVATDLLGLSYEESRLLGSVDVFEPEHGVYACFACSLPMPVDDSPDLRWCDPQGTKALELDPVATAVLETWATGLTKQVLQDEE